MKTKSCKSWQPNEHGNILETCDIPTSPLLVSRSEPLPAARLPLATAVVTPELKDAFVPNRLCPEPETKPRKRPGARPGVKGPAVTEPPCTLISCTRALCATHRPVFPLANLSHRVVLPVVPSALIDMLENAEPSTPHWHRFPPPCALQKSVLPCALFPQPTLQRLPPPCLTQKSVLPRALLAHPSTAHRFPPPWATQ